MGNHLRKVKVFKASTEAFKAILRGEIKVTNMPPTAYIQDFRWDMQRDTLLVKVYDDSFPEVPAGMMYPEADFYSQLPATGKPFCTRCQIEHGKWNGGKWHGCPNCTTVSQEGE